MQLLRFNEWWTHLRNVGSRGQAVFVSVNLTFTHLPLWQTIPLRIESWRLTKKYLST